MTYNVLKILCFSLFSLYLAGAVAEKDLREADPIIAKKSIPDIIEKAKNGSAEAQFQLGTAYGRGIGVQINHNKAWEWISKAAENNHPEAQFWVGYNYFYGTRGEIDNAKAFSWFKKSAEQGYPNAQFMVAHLLDTGKVKEIKKNINEAIKWYSTAGNKGHAQASFQMGCKSYFGLGVAKDERIALGWFELADRNGDPIAGRFIKKKDPKVIKGYCYN